MLALALSLAFAPQVAPPPSLRALLEAAPVTWRGEALVDVLIDDAGRPRHAVVRDAAGRESLLEWSALAGGAGTWSLDAPLLEAAPSLLEVEPAAFDRNDYGPLFAQAVPELLSGVVQSVDHERAADEGEFALLRVQVEQGDLVRVALGPTGWHARGLGLPVSGDRAHVRAVATRDERGLLWIAAGLRLGNGPELRLRGDDGAPLWQELACGERTRSARALFGRRLSVAGETLARVEDVLLERGTGAPRTVLQVARSAGGGVAIPLAWERVSFADDGSVQASAGDLGADRGSAGSLHP